VVIDPFNQGLYANANIGVFGHSGAGKTFLLSSLALGAYAAGSQVFVLDPEHEYGGIAAALGGQDIRLALGSGHSLNVLPAVAHEGGAPDEAWLGPAAADAVDLVAVLAGGLDEAERAGVERAVRAAYLDDPEPVLGHVARRLPSGRTRTVLERWVEGSLGAMFSQPTNVDLDANFVVFGMREMRDELIAPVHFLLAEALWSRIKGRGRRRLLLIDELGLLFEDPILRRFVVALARRIRKYDGSLVFATQNPGDLLASEAGAVVATNPSIHFFGAARPGEAGRLQQAFQLSPAQRSLVETARRGEFLLAAGSERLPLRVMAPDWQVELLDRVRGRRVPGRDPP
jgi:type IV secretory pathway VirB4 component